MHSAQCSVPHGASTRPQSSWENKGELHGGSSKTKTQNYLTPFFPISSSPPFSTTQQHSNTHTTHTNVDTGATPTAVAARDTFLASDGARVTTKAGLQVSEPGRVVLLARASRSPDQKHLISRTCGGGENRIKIKQATRSLCALCRTRALIRVPCE